MNRNDAARVMAAAFSDELEKIAKKGWSPPTSYIHAEVGKPVGTPASKTLSARNAAREGYAAMRAPAPQAPTSAVAQTPPTPPPKPPA